MPDLFNGDAVPMAMAEGPQLNLTEWRARHPTWQIDQIIEQTIVYMRSLGINRIGAVGYCLGGKHVPRFMAPGKGIDLGFIAHPANLTSDEIQAISGPISIAAGGKLAALLFTMFEILTNYRTRCPFQQDQPT